MEKSKRLEREVMVCLRMPPELKRKMKTFAASKGITVKEWIINLLEKNLT